MEIEFLTCTTKSRNNEYTHNHIISDSRIKKNKVATKIHIYAPWTLPPTSYSMCTTMLILPQQAQLLHYPSPWTKLA